MRLKILPLRTKQKIPPNKPNLPSLKGIFLLILNLRKLKLELSVLYVPITSKFSCHNFTKFFGFINLSAFSKTLESGDRR